MMRRFQWLVVPLSVAMAFVGADGYGQNRSNRNSGTQSLNQRFEQAHPLVGEALPDITAFDRDGHEFKLKSLRGHYTVLVFGCLT